MKAHHVDFVDKSVDLPDRPRTRVAGAKLVLIAAAFGLVVLWSAFLIWLAIQYIF
jgi:hypothetical protein